MICEDRLRYIQTTGNTRGRDAQEMAKELLALRKALSEPAAWVHPQAFINFNAGTADKEWMWAKKEFEIDEPLFRKPNLPL